MANAMHVAGRLHSTISISIVSAFIIHCLFYMSSMYMCISLK